MPWKMGLVVACILLGGWLAPAQPAPRVKYVAPHNVSAADGPGMFRAYCSVCHGLDGMGDGPAASALRKRPADLTQLGRKYGGKFPAFHVANVIAGADVVAAHGSRDMPIWGNVFRTLGSGTVKLRIDNLTRYIESIQRP
jgi:mono/diheme cytochrome c family protein